jgi:hypothetical protein
MRGGCPRPGCPTPDTGFEGGRPLTPVSAARLLGVSQRMLYSEFEELGVV